MTYDEAIATLTAPGAPFSTSEIEIDGVTYKVFDLAAMTLRDLFSTARARADQEYLVYEDERWTFGDVMAHADATANLLVNRYGVEKGDRVGVAMRNFPEWMTSYIAITSIGAICVSYNAWWTSEEMEYAIEDSGTKVLICDKERAERAGEGAKKLDTQLLVVRSTGSLPEGAERLEDVLEKGAPLPEVQINLDDDATILYTSGTTGFSKGAVSTHRAIVNALIGFACRAAVDGLRGTASNPLEQPAEGETSYPNCFILAVPLFHVTGNVPVFLGTFLGGTKLVMMYKWDPERALELVERERITTFVGVPTMWWDMLESPKFDSYDTSSLKSVGGGGAPAPPEVVKRVESTFKNARPGIGYGMTETNAYGPQNGGDDYVTHPTSCGRATPILEITIRDEDGNVLGPNERGEIWFKGPNLIRGYWNKPDATAETIIGGWLRTGDIGRIDEDGFVYIEDRAKDMILRGGENVYSAEVEAAIYQHPAVYEAAVFGVPHERLGEQVACAIYVKPGMSLTAEELQAHVRQHLAPFKVPEIVEIVDEQLPRNPAGKILKRQLRDQIANRS